MGLFLAGYCQPPVLTYKTIVHDYTDVVNYFLATLFRAESRTCVDTYIIPKNKGGKSEATPSALVRQADCCGTFDVVVKAQSTTLKRKAFLSAYEHTCSISRAAKAAEIDRGTHYGWLENDPEYRLAFARARERAADALEDEAVRRAREGTERAVTVAGKREIVVDYSDLLLIFLLKGMRPEKYRERSEVRMPALEGTLAEVLRSREDKVNKIIDIKPDGPPRLSAPDPQVLQ